MSEDILMPRDYTSDTLPVFLRQKTAAGFSSDMAAILGLNYEKKPDVLVAPVSPVKLAAVQANQESQDESMISKLASDRNGTELVKIADAYGRLMARVEVGALSGDSDLYKQATEQLETLVTGPALSFLRSLSTAR